MILAAGILFLILLAYFYGVHAEDNNNWLRALILAVGLPLLSLLSDYADIGMIGWIISIILAFILVMKVTGKDFLSSFLFLLVLSILMKLLEFGLLKFTLLTA